MPEPPCKLKCLVLGSTRAGKTSLLRRYFYGKFEADSRVPTLGSDWYTKTIPNPLYETNNDTTNKNASMIRLQLWDTPGRERLDAKRQRQHHQQQQPSLRESFLEQADAFLLVYDVTSSTSFQQLLKWYADLLKLKSALPILIVGTKMDLLMDYQQHHDNDDTTGDDTNSSPHRPHRKLQRSVMGLQSRPWRGLNYQYEYQVSKIVDQDELEKGGGEKRMEIASYLADRDNWTTDWGYLEGLWSSEDASHPDRDMVILWCGRNDLQHFEVSAATGQGVDEAIRALVILALQAKTKEASVTSSVTAATEQCIPATPSPSSNHIPDNLQLMTALKHNKALDLHQRYAPKDELCCHSRTLGFLLRSCRK